MYDLSIRLGGALGAVGEVHVAQQQHGGEHADHVEERDAEDSQAALPRVKARAVLRLRPTRVWRRQVSAESNFSTLIL